MLRGVVPGVSGCNHHNRETANIYEVSRPKPYFSNRDIGLYTKYVRPRGLKQRGAEGNSILSRMTLDEKISYIGGTPTSNTQVPRRKA